MSRIEIFNPAKVTEPEQVTYLMLVKGYGGRVNLKAVDERGAATDCGNLMTFHPDGRFELIPAAEVVPGTPLREMYGRSSA